MPAGNGKLGEYKASLTKEERIEEARKAGIASGEARRRKREEEKQNMRIANIARKMLLSDAPEKQKEKMRQVFGDLDDDEFTIAAAMVATMIEEVTKRKSVSAFKELMELTGEHTTNVNLTGDDGMKIVVDYGE